LFTFDSHRTTYQKADQVNPNTSLLTALYVLQSLLESSVSRKTNQKVLMLGWLSVGTIPSLSIYARRL
jgi:hypothetical protein